MFISFATLILSMITLPSTCYASPSLVTASGTDVTSNVTVDSYLENYSGNNEFVVHVENLRPSNSNLTIGSCPVLSYAFTITQDNTPYQFAIQYELGGINYDTLQVTTFVHTFSGSLGTISYDNSITSNLYLGDCYFKYNGGIQLLGDIYYTANEYYSTSRQHIAGWQLTDSTLVSSFSFGFTIAFFPPTFYSDVDSSSVYQDGYNKGKIDGIQEGFNNGYQSGYEEGYDVAYDVYYDSRYTQGYNQGVYDESLLSNKYTFANLFGALADTPIMILRSLLGFEVFGTNAMTILMSMVTACIALFVIRKII